MPLSGVSLSFRISPEKKKRRSVLQQILRQSVIIRVIQLRFKVSALAAVFRNVNSAFFLQIGGKFCPDRRG